MEKKQTAVQWLSNEIDFMFSFVNQETANKFNAIVQQAIQMEREQIEDAFVAGDERGTNDIPFNAEQYYTQTFKP